MENLTTVNYDELSYDEFFNRDKKYYNRLIKNQSLDVKDQTKKAFFL